MSEKTIALVRLNLGVAIDAHNIIIRRQSLAECAGRLSNQRVPMLTRKIDARFQHA